MAVAGLREEEEWVSWGRTLRGAHRIARPRSRREVETAFRDAAAGPGGALAAGLARSYGDSGLNPGGTLIDMTGLDRFIAFDEAAGVLRAEAGASLSDILRFSIPRGYFLPTTPGTRFVTLGGAIAHDVHGKNHSRAGAFGRFVRRIALLRSDRGVAEIAPGDALFAATVGGLGLTGIILWADIALAPIASSRIDQETVAFGDVDEYFDIVEESEARFEHTVAWIDCAAGERLGRGLFSRGDWAPAGPRAAGDDSRGPAIPVDAPAFLLNRWTLKAFNEAYFRLGRLRAGRSNVTYEKFFYPLDRIGGWNRLYGGRGFYQYQSVVPPGAARDATRAMLAAIASEGEGSMLAVLKPLGALPSPGLLSFPMAGTTLALDFPNRGEKTLRLLARLDAIVAEAGGRLYAAKDGRMPAAMFRRGYPYWEEFRKWKDPAMTSSFWRRVAE